MEGVEGGGVRLAFERTGASGDPVVLIHGGWDDHRSWDPVVPRLAEALRVIAYDRRGHGESRGPARDRPVHHDASDLGMLLETTGEFPAHLVGQGFGGVVALRLAVDRPELVRSVVAHEPPFVAWAEGASSGPSASGSVAAQVRRIQALARSEPELAAEAYLAVFASPEEQWGQLGPSARRELASNGPAWAEEMADPEVWRAGWEELSGVPVPVLLTAGGRSPAFAARVDERLASSLPNATAVRLSEGGHFVQRTDPGLWVGVLGSFLLERNVPST